MNRLAKVYCPVKQCWKYVEACMDNCRHKDTCRAIQEYVNPRLM